ncbi:unnamed protein product [Mytilus coruscus]|uniref:Novel STAND NTPase 3 domain-containing protein n=1 Tax=Mytilus coruscus TaxID=42192 RepID=A0A6J8DR78_MYTCO|nr:unnamed protein product [Mytilus coruscus]
MAAKESNITANLEFQKETIRDWNCKLDKFVKTRAAEVIYNHIVNENVILIAGPSGVGKSTLAYYVAFKLKDEAGYTILPASKPEDIINYNIRSTKQFFIIDDFIGKFAVDETDAGSWETSGPLLKILFSKTDHTKLILTSRTYIWQPERYSYLNMPYYTCDLISDDLQLLPKREMGYLDVNQCDKDNCSSLAFACKTGNAGAVNLLLTYGEDINFQDNAIVSPLHTTCMHNKKDIVLILINNNANVNAQDKFGKNPLFKSCFNGYIDIVKILLHNGAAVNICDTDEISPMAMAHANGNTDVAEVFREYIKTFYLV